VSRREREGISRFGTTPSPFERTDLQRIREISLDVPSRWQLAYHRNLALTPQPVDLRRAIERITYRLSYDRYV
jgi:hypothetical protein